MNEAVWDPVGHAVLRSGTEDWVDLLEVVSFVRELDPGLTERTAMPRAVAVVRSLLREDLVLIGEVTEQGFRPWPEEPAQAERRLEHATETVPLPLRFGDVCWLENTHLGNQYGTSPANFRFAAPRLTSATGDGGPEAETSQAPDQEPADTRLRNRVLTYLRDGAPLPGGYYTDGEWIWQEEICQDLADHGVLPEPDFMTRIEAQGGYCPPVTTATAAAANAALARARARHRPTGRFAAGSGR